MEECNKIRHYLVSYLHTSFSDSLSSVILSSRVTYVLTTQYHQSSRHGLLQDGKFFLDGYLNNRKICRLYNIPQQRSYCLLVSVRRLLYGIVTFSICFSKENANLTPIFSVLDISFFVENEGVFFINDMKFSVYI